MLRFYRKAFRSGVILVKEKVIVGGQETWVGHSFTPRDNGTTESYQNEPYLLEKYPVLFTEVQQ